MELLSRYELIDRIGRGGMATVHRARVCGIAGFERIVAVKQLLPSLASSAADVGRFVREARIASWLAHTNIVQVHDIGCSDAGHFMVMEYLEGQPLDQLAAAARASATHLPLGVVLSLLLELCDALDHIHTRTGNDGRPLDIVHRDISLANLFVRNSGHLKLLDFGIATARGLVAPTEVAGKPGYMAPETIRRGPTDARVDIFAFGVVAWELLTGVRLFHDRNDSETFQNVLCRPVPPPSQYRRATPKALDDLVLAALERDPARRISSAAQLRDRVDVVIRSTSVDAKPSAVARWLAQQPNPDALPPPPPQRAMTVPTEIEIDVDDDIRPTPRVAVGWLRVLALAAFAASVGSVVLSACA